MAAASEAGRPSIVRLNELHIPIVPESANLPTLRSSSMEFSASELFADRPQPSPEDVNQQTDSERSGSEPSEPSFTPPHVGTALDLSPYRYTPGPASPSTSGEASAKSPQKIRRPEDKKLKQKVVVKRPSFERKLSLSVVPGVNVGQPKSPSSLAIDSTPNPLTLNRMRCGATPTSGPSAAAHRERIAESANAELEAAERELASRNVETEATNRMLTLGVPPTMAVASAVAAAAQPRSLTPKYQLTEAEASQRRQRYSSDSGYADPVEDEEEEGLGIDI